MDNRGFSVAELLTALFIASLLFAAALPKFWGLSDRMKIDGEAAKLAAHLTEYRDAVMTRAGPHSDFIYVPSESPLSFDFDRGGYGARQGSADIFRYRLPEGMILSSGGRVNFKKNGNADPMTMKLSLGNEERYVIIDIVGRVRVSETPP